MTEAKAKKIKKELEEFCKKHGLWFFVKEVNKPELKDIEITVSVKITE